MHWFIICGRWERSERDEFGRYDKVREGDGWMDNWVVADSRSLAGGTRRLTFG